MSSPNLWLADHLLDIFSEHRKWLEKFPFLLASVVYNYLRIIEDHRGPGVERLLEKEIKFVVSLMRERFSDVVVIGRDLVRVLQYVAKIPEFEELWTDMIHRPKSLFPQFGGITQLMHTRTSRRFLQSRITPEMEKKLVFLTSSVSYSQTNFINRVLFYKKMSGTAEDSLSRHYLLNAPFFRKACTAQPSFFCYRFALGPTKGTRNGSNDNTSPRWSPSRSAAT